MGYDLCIVNYFSKCDFLARTYFFLDIYYFPIMSISLICEENGWGFHAEVETNEENPPVFYSSLYLFPFSFLVFTACPGNKCFLWKVFKSKKCMKRIIKIPKNPTIQGWILLNFGIFLPIFSWRFFFFFFGGVTSPETSSFFIFCIYGNKFLNSFGLWSLTRVAPMSTFPCSAGFSKRNLH